ncbi:MAG: methyltransferase domain-containing protein [Chloroflexota bacterium]
MTSKNWQLSSEAAVQYEQVLVKYILGAFAVGLVEWASLEGGVTVVDVGCGTGAAARHAATKVGSSGQVIGVDVNAEMLNVARSLPAVDGAAIEWRQENAYEMSLEDSSVNAVLCAQVLQFIPEKVKALREMRRVIRDDGAVYVSLWSGIGDSPYFDGLVATIAEHINPDTAAGLGAAFGLSDLDAITSLFTEARFANVVTDASTITLKLPPLENFIPQHIRATPMGIAYDKADAATQAAIVTSLTERLMPYVTKDGAEIPFRSYWVKATTE